MNVYAKCLAIIFAAHIGSVVICDQGSAAIVGLLFTALLVQAGTNTFLHITFCRSGRVAPFALPLMWISCIFPLYIYCNFLMPRGVFFGRDFAFIVYGLCILAPAIVISLITALISFLTRKFAK